jgi:hypothetical protein
MLVAINENVLNNVEMTFCPKCASPKILKLWALQLWRLVNFSYEFQLRFFLLQSCHPQQDLFKAMFQASIKGHLTTISRF